MTKHCIKFDSFQAAGATSGRLLGYAVVKALRSDPAFVDVKIIALTAWGDAVSREKLKEAGFDLHITKPAKLSLLLSLNMMFRSARCLA